MEEEIMERIEKIEKEIKALKKEDERLNTPQEPTE